MSNTEQEEWKKKWLPKGLPETLLDEMIAEANAEYETELGVDKFNNYAIVKVNVLDYPILDKNGLIAYFPFLENDGLRLIDRSGKGNNGEINNCTLQDGKYGNGIASDGTQHAYFVKHLIPTTAFTFAFWVKGSGSGEGGVGVWIGTEGGAGWIGYHKASKVIGFGCVESDTFSIYTLPDQTNFHHVAGTWDGTTLKLYINGLFKESWLRTFNPTSNTQFFSTGGTNFGNSVLDNILIYNRALTDSEIETLFLNVIADGYYAYTIQNDYQILTGKITNDTSLIFPQLPCRETMFSVYKLKVDDGLKVQSFGYTTQIITKNTDLTLEMNPVGEIVLFNRLLNGGFETGVSPWNISGSAIGSQVGAQYKGSRGMVFHNYGSPYGAVNQTLSNAIEADRVSEVSCWVKAVSAHSFPLQVGIIVTYLDDTFTEYKQDVTGTDYTKVSMIAFESGQTIKSVTIWLSCEDTITYWLDDVFLLAW
jgi:hypothetical protein